MRLNKRGIQKIFTLASLASTRMFRVKTAEITVRMKDKSTATGPAEHPFINIYMFRLEYSFEFSVRGTYILKNQAM